MTRRWQYVVDVEIDEAEMEYEDEIERRTSLVAAFKATAMKYRGVKSATSFFETEIREKKGAKE